MPPKPVRRAARAFQTHGKGRLLHLLRRWPALWRDETLGLWSLALEPGPVDWLGWLLSLDADPNQAADADGNTPLMRVAGRRLPASLDLARRLIGQGAALDNLNARGESALSWAASANFGSMLELLLSAGADPRAGRGEFVAPATARCWSSPELQRLLEQDLSAEERAELPPAWTPSWHDDLFGDCREWIDIPDGRGGFRWIRNPYPGWLWTGSWPPPSGPPSED